MMSCLFSVAPLPLARELEARACSDEGVEETLGVRRSGYCVVGLIDRFVYIGKQNWKNPNKPINMLYQWLMLLNLILCNVCNRESPQIE